MTETVPPEAAAAANAEAQAGSNPHGYDPCLAQPVVYVDEHGVHRAALVTSLYDGDNVGLIVFPDESHHRHVRASAIASDAKGPGWFPSEA